MQEPTKHFHAIDAIRLFACLAVVSIHTGPFDVGVTLDSSAVTEMLYRSIETLTLFAVPFFFTASGFFFAWSVQRRGLGPGLRLFVQRNAGLFLLWTLLYWIMPTLDAVSEKGLTLACAEELRWVLQSAAKDPGRMLLVGGEIQLWFLSSLCQAAVLCSILLRIGKGAWILPLAGLLYGIGLLNQGYGALYLPLTPDWNTRIGPWFATLPFALGMAANTASPRLLRGGAWLAAGGMACIVAEKLLIHSIAGKSWHGHYYVGSAALGLGLVLWAVSRPAGGRPSWLSRLGKYSAGVYLSHMFLVNFLERTDWDCLGELWWQPVFPVLVWALCLAAGWLVSLPFHWPAKLRPSPPAAGSRL